MAAQDTNLFSKLLTRTDVNKRLAIPTRFLSSLPSFDGRHAVSIHLLYGTRIWPIVCTVRRKGNYKKPVFSGGLGRDFVIRNNLDVSDKITVYKVVDEDGASSHYRVELEKLAGHRAKDVAAMACGGGTSDVGGEGCCNIVADHRLNLSNTIRSHD